MSEQVNTGSDAVKKSRRQKKIKRYRINMTLKQFRKYVSVLQTGGAEMMKAEMDADEQIKERGESDLPSESMHDDVNKMADVRGSLTSRSKSNVTAAHGKALAHVISYKQQQQPQQKVVTERLSKTKSVVWKILQTQTDETAASTSLVNQDTKPDSEVGKPSTPRHRSAVTEDARPEQPPCTPRHSRCVACTYKKLFPEKEDTQLSLQERHKSAENIFMLSQADIEDWVHDKNSCFAELFADSRPKSDTLVTSRNKNNSQLAAVGAKKQEQTNKLFNIKPRVSDTQPAFSKASKPDHSSSKQASNITSSLPLPNLTNSMTTSTNASKKKYLEVSSSETTIPANNKVGVSRGGIIKSKSLIQLPALGNYEATKSDTTFEKHAKRALNPPLLAGRHQKPGDVKRWMFTSSPTPVRVFLSFYDVPQEKYIEGITDENGRPLLPVSRQHILRGMIYDRANKALYPPLPNTPKRKGLRMANLMNRTVNKTKRKREKSDTGYGNERADSVMVNSIIYFLISKSTTYQALF